MTRPVAARPPSRRACASSLSGGQLCRWKSGSCSCSACHSERSRGIPPNQLNLTQRMFRLRSMRLGQWPRRRTCHDATVAAIQARACYSSRGPLGFSNAPSEIIREAGGSGVLESSTRCTFGPIVSSSGWVLAIFTGVPILTSA